MPARRSVVADPPGRRLRRVSLEGMRMPGFLKADWWEWDSADELLTWNQRSMILVPATEVFFALPLSIGLARDGHVALTAVAVVLVLAHTAAVLAVSRTGRASSPRGSRSRALAALAVTAVALAAVGILAFPGTLDHGTGDPRLQATALAGTFTAGALALSAPMRRLAWLPLLTGAIGLVLSVDSGQNPWAGALIAGGLPLMWGKAIHLENSFGRLVAKLQAARETEARLAVTEERLRFSRDVHDVVGHALSAVAVKSELAAELTRRGHDDKAAAEMLAVRELAQDALRQTRALVTGYRAADLATEMSGARSLLASAGVSARVVGEPGDLPEPVQDVLAWVVRESATNIVRHSTARTAVIDLTADAAAAVLRITNDGAGAGAVATAGATAALRARIEHSVPIRALERSNRAQTLDAAEAASPVAPGTAAPARAGTGLTGLRERLAAVGGTLTTTHDGDRFVVEARVPVASPGSGHVTPLPALAPGRPGAAQAPVPATAAAR